MTARIAEGAYLLIEIQELLTPELRRHLGDVGARTEAEREGDHHKRRVDRNQNVRRGPILNARRVYPGRAPRQGDPPDPASPGEGAADGGRVEGRRASWPQNSKTKGERSEMKGIVKWFSPERGYGVITGRDGKDYFCHYSDIVGKGWRNLEAGQEVAFEIAEGKGGKLKAIKVEPLQIADSESIEKLKEEASS